MYRPLMRAPNIRTLLFNFIAGAILIVASDAQAQPITILTAVVTAQECDAGSPAFQVVNNNRDPQALMSLDQCMQVQDFNPIASQRFVSVSKGELAFRFLLSLSEQGRAGGWTDGPKLHATYKITVTARGPNGQIATNSGAVTLYGSQATDAPSAGWKASPDGGITSHLDIPLNVDWAESTISFTVEASQGLGSDEPATESCTTAEDRRVGLMCTHPDWVDQVTLPGPDLSAINAKLTLPAAIDNSAFALFVMPALKFQLPVMPVAIVYAPLGNGPSASSTYQLTTATGTSTQIGNSQTSTTSWAGDDKTAYSAALKVSDIADQASGTVTLQGSWDNAAEIQNQSTYGTTAQIISSDTIMTNFKVPAASSLPLNKLDWSSQPYWKDLILVVVDPQFAIWDYPGGPIVQPLGSVTTIPIPLLQLEACRSSDTAQQTDTPNSVNESHFLAYAGQSSGSSQTNTTHYVWLTSKDCADIASLDEFYARGTQSATLPNYRKLYGGSVYTASPLTVTSTQAAQLIAGQNSGMQYSQKITAVQSDTTTVAGTATAVLQALFIKVTGSASASWSFTSTQSQTTTVNYTSQNSTNLQTQTQASTTIQDSSGITAPIIVLQDSLFQGIAVQDTDMHYTPPGPNLGRFKELRVAYKLIPNQTYYGLHAVDRLDATSPTRKDTSFVERSPYGEVIIQRAGVSSQSVAADQAKRARQIAITRHFNRPIPDPPPATATLVDAADALKTLQSIRTPGAEIQRVIGRLAPQ